jgi:hypothetical protein
VFCLACLAFCEGLGGLQERCMHLGCTGDPLRAPAGVPTPRHLGWPQLAPHPSNLNKSDLLPDQFSALPSSLFLSPSFVRCVVLSEKNASFSLDSTESFLSLHCLQIPKS